jgi:hypothetical protein
MQILAEYHSTARRRTRNRHFEGMEWRIARKSVMMELSVNIAKRMKRIHRTEYNIARTLATHHTHTHHLNFTLTSPAYSHSASPVEVQSELGCICPAGAGME